MSTMIRTVLPKEVAARVRELAKEEHRSVSAWLRILVEAEVAKRYGEG